MIQFLRFFNLLGNLSKSQVSNHLQDNKFSSKDNDTPLSEIDIKSNEIISSGIRKIDKTYPIISEEHYEDINPGDSFWIIDPLDGTRNYLNHGNEFCINIAFIKNEYPSFGLIYSPISKISYYAIEGSGSVSYTHLTLPTNLCV